MYPSSPSSQFYLFSRIACIALVSSFLYHDSARLMSSSTKCTAHTHTLRKFHLAMHLAKLVHASILVYQATATTKRTLYLTQHSASIVKIIWVVVDQKLLYGMCLRILLQQQRNGKHEQILIWNNFLFFLVLFEICWFLERFWEVCRQRKQTSIFILPKS